MCRDIRFRRGLFSLWIGMCVFSQEQLRGSFISFSFVHCLPLTAILQWRNRICFSIFYFLPIKNQGGFVSSPRPLFFVFLTAAAGICTTAAFRAAFAVFTAPAVLAFAIGIITFGHYFTPSFAIPHMGIIKTYTPFGYLSSFFIAFFQQNL